VIVGGANCLTLKLQWLLQWLLLLLQGVHLHIVKLWGTQRCGLATQPNAVLGPR
jgi:hypothetical protein